MPGGTSNVSARTQADPSPRSHSGSAVMQFACPWKCLAWLSGQRSPGNDQWWWTDSMCLARRHPIILITLESHFWLSLEPSTITAFCMFALSLNVNSILATVNGLFVELIFAAKGRHPGTLIALMTFHSSPSVSIISIYQRMQRVHLMRAYIWWHFRLMKLSSLMLIAPQSSSYQALVPMVFPKSLYQYIT